MQEPEYEMRICDGSSDVCSADLRMPGPPPGRRAGRMRARASRSPDIGPSSQGGRPVEETPISCALRRPRGQYPFKSSLIVKSSPLTMSGETSRPLLADGDLWL